MSSNSTRILLTHQPFLLYFLTRNFSDFAYQMSAVAIGWQVYSMTGSAFMLGMAGLVQFLPTAILVFAAGHAADQYDRKRIVQICRLVKGLVSFFLAWGSFEGWLNVHHIFASVALLGVAGAFESPAAASLLPAVTPKGMLQEGAALSTGAFHLALISAPALSGLFYAIAPWVPYAIMAVCWLISAVLNGMMKLERKAIAKEPPTFKALFAGIHFVRSNPIILGAISLDLFAVLLGGATALMPIYARDILHTGPWGLGVLRGAPAIGALLMSGFLASYPLRRKVGTRMFQSLIVFGAGTIIFALSHDMILSVIALTIMGAADTISMVVRASLVQLGTPDEMRGRVSAVNFLFVNASNQLGEFESGVTAALVGVVPAAVLGGVGTILVAIQWMKIFPVLRHMEKLE